jgi:hypothetical protein
MKFLKPTEDIERNTLSAWGGLFDRLAHLARLRQQDGKYKHWGLAREYGAEASSRALEEVHRVKLSESTRQSLSSLWREMQSSAQQAGAPVDTYVGKIVERRDQLVASKLNGPALLHFDWVLHSLLKVARAQAAKRPAAASQPQPPGPPPRSPADI